MYHSFTEIETPSDTILNKTLIKSEREIILNFILGFTLQKGQIEGKKQQYRGFFVFPARSLLAVDSGIW